jgi:hypothetical protein
MNRGIEALRRLADLGYRISVDGQTIKAHYEGQGSPDPAMVRPLLALVKQHKIEAIDYLTQKSYEPERVLTCHECGYFRPAISSPNPTQAWGYCQKRKKGRYGVATACEAVFISE